VSRLAVLVHPDGPMPERGRPEPLGLGYLAATVPTGWEAGVVDAFGRCLGVDAAVAEVCVMDPDVVGISMPHNPQVPAALEIAGKLRQRLGPVPIVFGGNYPTVRPAKVFSAAPVDVIVAGEGERTFAELLTAIGLSGGTLPDEGELRTIPGLCLRRAGDRASSTPPREPIRDLDGLPWPRRDLLAGYAKAYPTFSVIASRGCFHGCCHCSASAYWQHRRRQRGAAAVASEVAALLRTYGPKRLTFVDDLFTADRDWTLDLCRHLRPLVDEIGLAWGCGTHFGSLDDELIAAMAAAGCQDASLRMESGSDRTLEVLGQRYTVATALERLRRLTDAGVRVNLSLTLGLPQETRQDLELTLAFLHRATTVSPLVGLSVNHLAPVAGTKLYEQRQGFGLTILDDDQFDLNPRKCRIRTRHLEPDDLDRAFLEHRIIQATRASRRTTAARPHR